MLFRFARVFWNTFPIVPMPVQFVFNALVKRSLLFQFQVHAGRRGQAHSLAEPVEHTLRRGGQVVGGSQSESGGSEPKRVHHQDRKCGHDG